MTNYFENEYGSAAKALTFLLENGIKSDYIHKQLAESF
jgi:hypothetical protein